VVAAIMAIIAALCYALAFFSANTGEWNVAILGHVFVALALFFMSIAPVFPRRVP
jgi:hypothetical protein